MKKNILIAALFAVAVLPANAKADHWHNERCNHGWERSHYNHHRHHRNDVWSNSSYVYAPQPYYYTSYYEPAPVYVVQRPAPVYVAPQPVFSLGLFFR